MGILRFWLATLILFNPNHIGLGLLNSFWFSRTAVLGFFIISGFCLQYVVNNLPRNKPWVARYYLSRALRIFPVYWFILAITTLFYMASPAHFSPPAALLTKNIFETGDVAAKFYYIASNISLLGQYILRWFVYDPASGSFISPASPADYHFRLAGVEALFIDQSWTLVQELLFYLCVPFLCTLPFKSQCGIYLLFLGLQLELTQYIWVAGGKPTVQRDFVMFLPYFMAGALALQIYTRYRLNQWPKRTKSLIVNIGFCVMVALGLLDKKMEFLLSQTQANLLFLSVLVVCLPFIGECFYRSKLDRFLGQITYPFYLSHIWLAQCVSAYITHDIKWIGIVTWIICFFFSAATVRYLEIFITRYRYKLTHAA